RPPGRTEAEARHRCGPRGPRPHTVLALGARGPPLLTLGARDPIPFCPFGPEGGHLRGPEALRRASATAGNPGDAAALGEPRPLARASRGQHRPSPIFPPRPPLTRGASAHLTNRTVTRPGCEPAPRPEVTKFSLAAELNAICRRQRLDTIT